MQDNPFSAIVKIIRDDNKTQTPISYRLGTVLSSDPMKVDVAGIVQDQRSLLKNDLLAHFTQGERLLLVPIEDEQRYIIICKVVDV